MDRRLSRRELLELGARAGALAATAPLIGSLAAWAPRTLPDAVLGKVGLAKTGNATTLKPALSGFLDEVGIPTYDWMLGYVRNLDWVDLQATSHGPIVATNRLASDIVAVRAFNTAHPDQAPRGLKLRTGAAGGAPADVKAIGGGPFKVRDPQPPSASGEVGAFWLPEYQAAYADFQSKLAAWLDPIPEVREVTMGLPALLFEEPFIRYSTNTLARGGWTLELDQKSFTAMLTAHQVWTATRQDLAYTLYSAPGGSSEWTLTFLKTARALFGAQLVDGNNTIQASSTNSPMYEAIAQAGPPIYFQTAGAAKIGGASATYEFAVSHGANSVEIYNYASLPESLLLEYQSKLIANPL
jgi:hypothetical protein